MRTGIYSIIILFLSIAASDALWAQKKDTVWYVEWYRYTGPYMGEEYEQSTVKAWLDGTRSMIRLKNDRYISIIGDTLYLLNQHLSTYTTGLVSLRELLWVDERVIRQRSAARPLKIIRTGRELTHDGYDAAEWVVSMVMNKLFIPVRQEMLVTRQTPLPDYLLEDFYMVQSFIEANVFTDWLNIADTLIQERQVPLVTRWHIEVPPDSTMWLFHRAGRYSQNNGSTRFLPPTIQLRI